MAETEILNYVIKEAKELSLSYISVINNGGLFVPTSQSFTLGEKIVVNLQLPGKAGALSIEGKIIWITPKNALHHMPQGIGVQFIGEKAAAVRSQIESQLDPAVEPGGYISGITSAPHKSKK